MLQKSNGFFLVEQLLSLSTLLVICLFFLPKWLSLSEQAEELQKEKQAISILFEELNSHLGNEAAFVNHLIFLNGQKYEVVWREDSITGEKEVCVQLDAQDKDKKAFCEPLQ